MGRLIDADAAVESLTEYGNGRAVYIGVEEAVRRIEQLPSAQPEIIRCKDCKYYKYGICMKIGANKSFYGFCDWAERREDEAD